MRARQTCLSDAECQASVQVRVRAMRLASRQLKRRLSNAAVDVAAEATADAVSATGKKPQKGKPSAAEGTKSPSKPEAADKGKSLAGKASPSPAPAPCNRNV